jgi:hypothetical protein
MLKLLIAVLLSLPVSFKDRGTETSEQRQIRMVTVAKAINEATALATCSDQYATDCSKLWKRSPKELALLLVSTARSESMFALNVHEGKCAAYECDAYKDASGKIMHRAHSLWQIHAGGLVSQKEWEDMVGTSYEATRTAAWAAVKILVSGFNACKSIEGSVSMYAGRGCSWSGAKERVVWLNETMKRPIE